MSTEAIDSRVLELAREVLATDAEFRKSFPEQRQMLVDKCAEVARLVAELEAVTSERDALKDQLQAIGRKAFWASNNA